MKYEEFATATSEMNTKVKKIVRVYAKCVEDFLDQKEPILSDGDITSTAWKKDGIHVVVTYYCAGSEETRELNLKPEWLEKSDAELKTIFSEIIKRLAE